MVLRLRVCADPAAEVARVMREVAAAGGHVALSGGSAPRPAYVAARAGDWTRATVWLVDERVVGPGDERSNARLVRETLAPARLRAVATELGPDAAAAAYDAALDGVTLDLAVLGIGPDGHTASLFPGRPEAVVSGRRVVAVHEAGMEPYVARVSMTLPFLNQSRRVLLLATGAAKRDVVRRVLAGEPLPASRIHGELLVDEAAAP